MSASQPLSLSQGPVPYRITDPLKPYSSSTFSVDSLYKWAEEGLLDLNPEYQRAVVWPEKKQIGLIDSLLRNFHIPPLVFAKSTDDEGFTRRICIDGKQRLTSIQNFINGQFPHPNPASPKDKYWYKITGDKPGYELPKHIREQFSQKQIVCIEYEDLDDKRQREIFRRVQLGVALNVAERMKALDLTPKSKLVRDLAADHTTLLREIKFTVKRDQETRWFATALMTVWRSVHEIIPMSNVSHERVRKWLEEPVEDEDDWETFSTQFTTSVDLLINIVTSNRMALHVNQPPLTVAPVDLVAMIHLIFTFRNRFSEADLARAIRQMRNLAREEFKDLRWNPKCIAPYANFMTQLKETGLDMLVDEDIELQEPNSDDERDELEDETPQPPASPQKRPPPSQSTRVLSSQAIHVSPASQPTRPVLPATPTRTQPMPSPSSSRVSHHEYAPQTSLGTQQSYPQQLSYSSQPPHPAQDVLSQKDSWAMKVEPNVAQSGPLPTQHSSSPPTPSQLTPVRMSSQEFRTLSAEEQFNYIQSSTQQPQPVITSSPLPPLSSQASGLKRVPSADGQGLEAHKRPRV